LFFFGVIFQLWQGNRKKISSCSLKRSALTPLSPCHGDFPEPQGAPFGVITSEVICAGKGSSGGKGSGWTLAEVKEDGILIKPETGEGAVYFTDEFLKEQGFVREEEIKDSLDYFQGRTITEKLIDEFLEDLGLKKD
jgi:hypothetical protein